jgi:hypothetical protein
MAALERWEQTLRASPADPDALAALSELYEGAQRWTELAQILERLDGGRPLPAQGTPDAAVRALDLERYATVLDTKLNDAVRATKAWHRVLELTPRNRGALDALARLSPRCLEVAGLPMCSACRSCCTPGWSHPTTRASDRSGHRSQILEGSRACRVDQGARSPDPRANPNHLDAHTHCAEEEAHGDFDAAVCRARDHLARPQRKIARGPRR